MVKIITSVDVEKESKKRYVFNALQTELWEIIEPKNRITTVGGSIF